MGVWLFRYLSQKQERRTYDHVIFILTTGKVNIRPGALYSLDSCFGVLSNFRVAVIRAKNHKRQRRKRQSVIAKREKSQTPKVLTAILTLPNLT